MQTKVKKPIYKRVWFWVAIVFILIMTLSIRQSAADQAKKDSTPTSAKEAKYTLMAIAEETIEKQNNISNVKIENDDIQNVIYQGKRKNKDTGEIYKYVYYMVGKYRYNNQLVSFNMTFNFSKPNIENDDTKHQILQYGDTSPYAKIFETNLSAKVD